jgi:hypothetical protein
MSKIENIHKKPRNKWTLMFAQMLALKTKDYDLEIDYEHELFRNPMRIDVVVVKKPENVVIKNSAMKFFRNYNVIEFKGPVDNLNVAKYNKVMAYFYAYLAGKKLSFDDVAITLVSIKKPLELLEYLEKERKYKIIPAKESGIYYIKAENLPATQLIVSKEVTAADLAWVNALRNDLTLKEGLKITKLFGEDEDVIQSLIFANKNLLKEMEDMQVKDPEIRRILERVSGKSFVNERQQGMQQGMRERNEAIARNLKAEGMDLHAIARVTGLSFDEVLNI